MCSSHIVNDNLDTAKNLIYEASKNDAKLIILPEMFAIMGLTAADKVAVREPFGKGKIQFFLEEQARNNQVWIVGGTIPIECEDRGKIRAASLVFDDHGKCVSRYDKIHLFDATISNEECYEESDTIEPGNKLVVIETPFGKLGLGVCYDIRFPELFRCLFNQGAEIIVIPSAFTVTTGEAHWELLARSRAVENFCYLVGACQGGIHSNGRRTYGNSIIIEPWGNVVARKADTSPGVIYASIDLKKINEARTAIPIRVHQRIFFDTSILDKNSISGRR